ncbi:receptor-interacting serine/threonine-protein kinase 3 isoform X4 [Amia ocellicauda]|uniref:receptor-interacting serine/threonine-protein kinase 3 isoform X4 n=1 Tax=Amia ocellicauda TaxID=2972642 RepID=UPI0034648D6C
MELTTCPRPAQINDAHLTSWCMIGRGGFGVIQRARHTLWGMDVAIKLLHDHRGDSSQLLREAELMIEGGCPFVLRVLGVYRGTPPLPGLRTSSAMLSCPSVGLVMEFMEFGCIGSLLASLAGPPPWPLAFRLAHQVALGMNFLHQHRPPLLHLDLKPSNVLLDNSLNAQITDFGLARMTRSVSCSKKGEAESGEGGTLSYMPPEAFSLKYRPSPASDVYSYAILLWSILTGEEPYSCVMSSLVRFRIPLGDRPSLERLDPGQARGLQELRQLIETCWEPEPQKRPAFYKCLPVTESVYNLYKPEVPDAVHRVQTLLCRMESQSVEEKLGEQMKSLQLSHAPPGCSSPSVPEQTESQVTPQHAHTGPPPVQENTVKSAKVWAPQPVRTLSDNGQMPKANPKHSHFRPPSQKPDGRYSPVMQFSPSQTAPYIQTYPPRPGTVMMQVSNVKGLQIGNNNQMTIVERPPPHQRQSQRKRHSTAPSAVNPPDTPPRK